MKKSWGLIPKILDSTKTIESRWYINKSVPWGNIKKGDIVYFKNSGEPVTVKAKVDKVLQFEKLNSQKISEILNKYYKEDGIEKEKVKYYFELFKDKKYCILIYLTNPQKIRSFDIDKKGFGSMSAWISVEDINLIKQVSL
ncbi:hypothetical protein A3D00_00450 [Candidatus Woesebacteria bacterium RIFCSPHIGHO2_02_FULL_38_9]|uniref:ASCH domain-containing protein n=1 Tax=Candidatus Woesebacteria bacterium RIFCSPHIGHO2_01_FULL_39_28 TaxID=1802496 RepID=A0A1F7YK35_9BACT|nr:MAG: hypothetical protein A2627_04700 [Candidatus Woesebacteria bacterium RIFCSPHIGHO2_01_FULL_39_28]OGM33201.1 MAG: hypothetical protein A3D00_00450 [Candidatus Woesebacteria bacterium RIFCSPHIGHO2_02_FULL_38_9]OGM57090.1 MAG: hypothetical protein A3A50_05505 [Candidatus Woesebacteria bacterium RIFCSPLOWO2_01_FULL_38_20]